MPDKHTVAQRYLAQVNNIISVGEAPVQTDHVSESGINYLCKALDSVFDALQDKAMLRRSTLALNVMGKERTASDFSDMASTITRMLQICTAVVLSQIDSIVVHAATARVMESYIDEISARSGPLFEGSKLTRRPLALTAIQMARRAREIPTHTGREEHEGATRDRVEADQKYGNKARTTIGNALKVGQVLSPGSVSSSPPARRE
ncbi:hypothetical protein D6D18_06212 [Aureobasidium pullulans]|nr:hypothetical protein D6D18_06212 [Aureobasidium pullulans]